MFRGTFLGQIIAVIGSLFLAKIYGTEAYGVFGVFISIASIGSIINTLQLEKCIVTTKSGAGSNQWYLLVNSIIPLVSILLLLITLLFFEFNLTITSNKTIIYLGVLGAIWISFYTTNESLLTFKKRFDIISNAKIIVPIFNVALQYILFSYYNVYGLVYGYIIAQTLIVLYFLWKNKKAFSALNLRFLKEEFQTQKSLLTELLPANTLNGIAIHVMPILILTFFGAAEAGVYFFTTKLLSTPLFLLSSSVSQVYFQKASELYHTNRMALFPLTKKIIKTNGLIMLVLLILINTLGMFILELILDESWAYVSQYTLLLSALILARSLFNPVSSLIVILRKHQSSLWFNLYLIVSNGLAIYIGVEYASISYAIAVVSLLGTLGYLSLLGYFWKVLKHISHV